VGAKQIDPGPILTICLHMLQIDHTVVHDHLSCTIIGRHCVRCQWFNSSHRYVHTCPDNAIACLFACRLLPVFPSPVIVLYFQHFSSSALVQLHSAGPGAEQIHPIFTLCLHMLDIHHTVVHNHPAHSPHIFALASLHPQNGLDVVAPALSVPVCAFRVHAFCASIIYSSFTTAVPKGTRQETRKFSPRSLQQI
jgi:hypothetical protein